MAGPALVEPLEQLVETVGGERVDGQTRALRRLGVIIRGSRDVDEPVVLATLFRLLVGECDVSLGGRLVPIVHFGEVGKRLVGVAQARGEGRCA